MCSGIDRVLFFSDNGVHTEVHLIVDDAFLYISCIYKSLLIFDLSIIHLQAHEHCVVTALVQSDHVDDDCVGFVGLTW